MKRNGQKKLATYLERRARQIRRGLIGDARLLADLLLRAAVALRQSDLRKVS